MRPGHAEQGHFARRSPHLTCITSRRPLPRQKRVHISSNVPCILPFAFALNTFSTHLINVDEPQKLYRFVACVWENRQSGNGCAHKWPARAAPMLHEPSGYRHWGVRLFISKVNGDRIVGVSGVCFGLIVWSCAVMVLVAGAVGDWWKGVGRHLRPRTSGHGIMLCIVVTIRYGLC